MGDLEIWAHGAGIFTAVIAVFGYGKYQFDLFSKQKKLEAYLKNEKDGAKEGNKGQRSILHLMANVGMTEAEILHASFHSKRLKRTIAANPATNRAEALLLEHWP